MAKLVIYEEFEDEETIFEDFELSVDRILIGSSEDNQLILDAPDIDPTHASLELRNETWIIQDLGAPGGTFVNGNEIDGPHLLQHNDLIELGDIKIKFQDNERGPERKEEPSTEEELSDDRGVHISGRAWFATLVGITLVIIFTILLLLIIADYLNLLKIADLLPFWPA